MTDIVRLGTTTNINTQAASPQAFNHTLLAGDNRIVMVAISGYSTSLAAYSVTYGGVAMTELSANRFAAGNLNQELWYILEADLPIDGVNSVEVSWTGGTSNQMLVACDAAKNCVQVVPSFEYNTENNAVTVGTDIDSGTNTWSFATANGAESGQIWSHNEGQIEIQDGNGIAWSGATTSTVYSTSHTGQFTSTKSGTNARLQRTHAVVEEEPAPTTGQFASIVTVQSAVTADMLKIRPFAVTVPAISGVTIGEFVYLRTNSSTIAAVTTVTSTFNRAVNFSTTVAATTTVTASRLLGKVLYVADVVATATVTSSISNIIFLATTIDAVATISASFGNTFNENISSLTPGCYVELFEIDTTVIGGGDIFRFIPGGYDVANVEWQGNEYTRFPVSVEGFEWNATSQAPPQPELKLSNVNKFVLAAVITLGDLVGAKVTRWRTYQQYLDGEDQADANAHFPPDIYFVQQKTAHQKDFITWVLSSALDLPGLRLPKRQVLRDETTGNLYAPGVSQVRFKGR